CFSPAEACMAANTIVVQEVTGQAWIRDADGSLIPLQEGMEIPNDAQIVTADGASVELQPQGQPTMTIGEGREVSVSAEMVQGEGDQVDNAAAPADPEAEAVLAALDAGEDPLDVVDPTAAMLQGGSDGAGGSSFTRLAAVIETTDPLALEYPRPIYPTTEDL